jgi:hypothetical protein
MTRHAFARNRKASEGVYGMGGAGAQALVPAHGERGGAQAPYGR